MDEPAKVHYSGQYGDLSTSSCQKWGLGKNKVLVLVARTRVGDTRAIVLPGLSTTEALTAVLQPMLRPGVTHSTDGSLAMRSAAQALGGAASPL